MRGVRVRVRLSLRRLCRRRSSVVHSSAEVSSYPPVDEIHVARPAEDNTNATLFRKKYLLGKKPCVLRGACPQVAENPPLTRSELTSMARILPSRALTRGPTEQPNDWSVTKGRHAVEAFEDSDDGKCSILVVNNIDRLHLGVSKIADDVLSIIDASGARMVLDDVQISLGARAGASVGPHTDSYSVFLLQVGSPKRWVVSSGAVDSLAPHVDDAHVADCPVRVLSDSAIAESKAELLETVVQPGDALYVPPHCVHYGSSVDDSDNYTYSVGVLAPSAQDVLLSFAAFASEQAAFTNHANGSTRRFDIVHEVAALDEEREMSAAHGTISHAHVRATQAFLRSLADDEDLVREWLGEHFTEAGMHVQTTRMIDLLLLGVAKYRRSVTTSYFNVLLPFFFIPHFFCIPMPPVPIAACCFS